ncbi:hypothetical protein [Arenimonas sp.]|jgi:hypothetical protein|uniref:hypothetical protein n=1 Tax=Arenimonas sp. TaxID=1872635 RepID=UPI0037BF3288
MDGFKDSTKVKYMCGGPVKKATGGVVKKFDGGGVYNERGKRATVAEVAAEGRRVENEMAARTAKRKPPAEGISTRPTDASGRRMTNAELGMTPGGVSPAKKAPAKSMNSAAELGALAAKKKKAVPAHSDRPMIRLPIPRSKGGLMAMPKGKC